LKTVEGICATFPPFADQSFDLVFHPVSNVFCPQVRPVWNEAFRVLRPGGLLLAGSANPIYYMIGTHADEQETLQIKYSIPYSDLESMDPEDLEVCIEEATPLEFGHSLTDLLGGQTDAGFAITGFLRRYLPRLTHQ